MGATGIKATQKPLKLLTKENAFGKINLRKTTCDGPHSHSSGNPASWELHLFWSQAYLLVPGNHFIWFREIHWGFISDIFQSGNDFTSAGRQVEEYNLWGKWVPFRVN